MCFVSFRMASTEVPENDTGLLGGLNASSLRALIGQLSQEQLDSLLHQLGISDPSDVFKLLEPVPTMHVHSYEQQLMSIPAYRLNKIILLYVPPILVILGTFGNIFSFIILKRKPMLKFSTYFYLMVLAVADTLVLYVGLLRLWIGQLTGQDLIDRNDWLCKITSVLSFTVSDYSVWLIIAVTVERYIAVCHPLKANSFCNKPRAKRVICGLLAFFFILNMHFFWTVKIVTIPHKGEEINRCDSGAVENVWPWVDAMIYSFLPFLIIIILNGCIIRQVVKAHRCRDGLRQATPYEQRRPSHEGSTRLTIMLLTISFAFLLTTLPLNIVGIATAFYNRSAMTDLHLVARLKLARTITEMLMYGNHSMNFFLYCATGQKFRHQLVWMVCYSKRVNAKSWFSENSQAATRLESVRIHTLKPRRLENGDTLATVRSEMYTPLKLRPPLELHIQP